MIRTIMHVVFLGIKTYPFMISVMGAFLIIAMTSFKTACFQFIYDGFLFYTFLYLFIQKNIKFVFVIANNPFYAHIKNHNRRVLRTINKSFLCPMLT